MPSEKLAGMIPVIVGAGKNLKNVVANDN